MQKNLPLQIVEVIVLGGIVLAFILPAFAPSAEQTETQSSLPLREQQPDAA